MSTCWSPSLSIIGWWTVAEFPSEVTLSWYDYTVLLGFSVHGAEDPEWRASIQGITERVRQRIEADKPENRKRATNGPCLECGVGPGGLHIPECSHNDY